jgi:hypothetical protein
VAIHDWPWFEQMHNAAWRPSVTTHCRRRPTGDRKQTKNQRGEMQLDQTAMAHSRIAPTRAELTLLFAAFLVIESAHADLPYAIAASTDEDR